MNFTSARIIFALHLFISAYCPAIAQEPVATWELPADIPQLLLNEIRDHDENLFLLAGQAIAKPHAHAVHEGQHVNILQWVVRRACSEAASNRTTESVTIALQSLGQVIKEVAENPDAVHLQTAFQSISECDQALCDERLCCVLLQAINDVISSEVQNVASIEAKRQGLSDQKKLFENRANDFVRKIGIVEAFVQHELETVSVTRSQKFWSDALVKKFTDAASSAFPVAGTADQAEDIVKREGELKKFYNVLVSIENEQIRRKMEIVEGDLTLAKMLIDLYKQKLEVYTINLELQALQVELQSVEQELKDASTHAISCLEAVKPIFSVASQNCRSRIVGQTVSLLQARVDSALYSLRGESRYVEDLKKLAQPASPGFATFGDEFGASPTASAKPTAADYTRMSGSRPGVGNTAPYDITLNGLAPHKLPPPDVKYPASDDQGRRVTGAETEFKFGPRQVTGAEPAAGAGSK